MSARTKIAFIIPCHDDGRFIQDAIASIETYPKGSYDLVIVDDGSTDDATIQVLSELRDSGYRVLSQENKGPAAARNAGIAATCSEYILPVDADNRIRPDFVENAVEVLDSRPEIDIVHSNFQYFGLSDHLCRIDPFDIRKMLYTNYIDTCALFRREVWEECGGYDECDDIRGLEDWEFWLNAYSHDRNFLHLDMVGFEYAHREGSQLSRTKVPEKWLKAERHIYTKYVMLLRDHYRDYHRWDFHGRELRRRPVRTLFRLFANAVYKRAHNKIFRVHQL